MGTLTDSRGEFVFESLPPEPMTLAVEAAGFAPSLDGPFDPTASGVRTIELRAGATLRGVLRDATGSALANEPITLSGCFGELGRTYRYWTLQTDAEGRFELGDLMLGTYIAGHELRFELGSVSDLNRSVEIAEPRVYELEIRPGGVARVSGTIHTSGKPAPLLTVRAEGRGGSWRAAIARDGHFELEGLEPGHWRFTVNEWGPPQTARLGTVEADVGATGETNVTIELLER
jgi:hypothetical protein